MLTKLTCYVGKDNVLCFEQLPVSLSKSKYYTGKSTKQDDEDWPESIDFLPNKSEEEKEDAETETPGIFAHRTEVLAIHQEQSGGEQQAYHCRTQAAEDVLD